MKRKPSISQKSLPTLYLLANAVMLCRMLREQLGVRVLLVDALNEKAASFYRAYGFRETADQACTLYLPLGRG